MFVHRWTLATAVAVVVVGAALATPQIAGAQATSAQDTSAKSKPVEKVKRGGANLITESEINSVNEENAQDIIQRLRPAMLRNRFTNPQSGGEGGGIAVYVDQARMGGIESLNTISRSQIKEIRFLNGPDATQRFGTGVPGGAIVITTKH